VHAGTGLEHVSRVGELELLSDDGTTVECDLVLMSEWKEASASTPMPQHVRDQITNRLRLVCRNYVRA
jgi:hypothetical protein